ncbi:hypothetical protein ADICEAN_03954 [Cesiribacter andamanensis AMV16]|uniref:Uncharacterized protein n=2 Tax=Cesiribacter TaxID=1133570 RepID=M7NGG6_9BACT|nr:hypothetical protein ADICEAN_03954 [Cesiribacter andamanensis AMV16]
MQAGSVYKDTAIDYLVALKTEVLNFLNGEPRLSYPEFYKMYGEAKAYFTTRETDELGIMPIIARMPALSKPSAYYINVRKLAEGCSRGAFRSYLYTSLLFISAPLSLPYLLLQTYQDRKIRLQLYKLYNSLEKLLWKLVTQ